MFQTVSRRSKGAIITESWKRSKCNILGLIFESVIKQPFNIVGQPLRNFEPWQTEKIGRDGNCLFRCLSQILTGNQINHLKLRSIISRFIASEGTTKPYRYFKSKQTTPSEYLVFENPIYLEGIWGSDVEIMCASAILDADIYIANNDYIPQGSIIREVRWSLLRTTTHPTATLYIANYCNHYEPVTSMLNSLPPTYEIISDEAQLVE